MQETYIHRHPHKHPTVRVTHRVAWLSLGVASAFVAVLGTRGHGNGVLTSAIVFAIAPDLPMFIGVNRALARGQLAPAAVPFYNAAHRAWAPILLLVCNIVWPGIGALLAGGFAWLAHIALDRGMGFGLRTREGFQRG